MAKPIYTIDTATGRASLELFFAQQSLTVYDYFLADDRMTLSERPNVDVLTLNEFRINVRQIGSFISMMREHFSMPLSSPPLFEVEMKRQPTLLLFKQEIEGDLLLDISYEYSALEATFQPRSETEIDFREFRVFYGGLQMALRESERVDLD